MEHGSECLVKVRWFWNWIRAQTRMIVNARIVLVLVCDMQYAICGLRYAIPYCGMHSVWKNGH